MKHSTPRDVKACCAAFYQSDLARMLLGDVLHPGGLALTEYLGESIGLTSADRVLDVACGRGVTAAHLAESFGCHVTGADFGAENAVAASHMALESGVGSLTDFVRADAEALPFDCGSFDVIVSECSFCTFPDKRAAACEMARALAPGGRLALSDVTVHGSLPPDIESMLAWVACLGGAGTPEMYVATLTGAGFDAFAAEDRREVLIDLVADVRRKLLGAEIVIALGKVNVGRLDLAEGKRLARRAAELVEQGAVGFVLIRASRVL